MKLSLAAALGAALLLAACASPAGGPRLAAPLDADPQVLRIHAPDDGAPHPAVLLVPGCEAPLISARAALYVRVAERLKKEGFTAAILAWPAFVGGLVGWQSVLWLADWRASRRGS